MREYSQKPFLYVAIAGVLILILYLLIAVEGTWRSDSHVIITSEQQLRVITLFESTWQRSPTDSELRELLDALARQEIALREATRLSIGKDDIVIRRRLQQNLESLAAEEATLVSPTSEELQLFLDDNADDFRVDPLLTFRQIRFDNEANAIGADASARFMLGRLRNQDMPEDISTLGDASALPAYFDEVREAEISPLFGREFAVTLSAGPVGEWVGPIQSALGLHIVYVDARVAGRIPQLDQIRSAVEEKWRLSKGNAAVDEMYRRLADNYSIAYE